MEVVPDATYTPFKYLLNGKVDIVLTSDHINNANLDFRPIFEDELVAIVSPDHPLASRKVIRPKDFLENPLVMYTVPDENSTILNEFFKPSGYWPNQILRLQLTEAVIEMTKAEMGMGILAEWSILPYVERGEVIAIPLNKRIRRTWYVVSLKNWKEPRFIQAFVESLQLNIPARMSQFS